MIIKNLTNGWVIVNIGHPKTYKQFIVDNPFERTRAKAIKEFIQGFGGAHASG